MTVTTKMQTEDKMNGIRALVSIPCSKKSEVQKFPHILRYHFRQPMTRYRKHMVTNVMIWHNQLVSKEFIFPIKFSSFSSGVNLR